MSVYNRYSFLKKKNKDSLILIKYKKRYVSFSEDLMILNHIEFKGSFKLLNKLKINYIVLEDLNVIENKLFDINNYMRYLKISYLEKIINKIGNI